MNKPHWHSGYEFLQRPLAERPAAPENEMFAYGPLHSSTHTTVEWYMEELNTIVLILFLKNCLKTIQKHWQFINYLIRSARTKIILYLVFWNLVLQTKQCLFQCCNHWLSRRQLFQNSFLRKQGWWDLKPIPVSLVDFWMHCSTSILFDRRAGVSRLVVETGGQAARNCTSLCSQQDRRQTLLLMTAFGRRRTTVNYCRHKLRLLTCESTPGSPHMHPCRRLSGGLP